MTNISNRKMQKLRTPDFVRLFWYARQVGRRIGKRKALALLEAYAIAKRREWLAENRAAVRAVKGSPVEKAFTVYYLLNQKLCPRLDAKIVKKTEDTIVTRWFNYCPVLEACKATGWDTRDICRRVYHRPNQVLLSAIDPRLVFDRDYSAVRPHGKYCEETITVKKRGKK